MICDSCEKYPCTKDGSKLTRRCFAYSPKPTHVTNIVDGDIYLNHGFGDLWIVDGGKFIKINDGYSIDLNTPVGFVKVGHIDDVQSTWR